MTGIAAHSIVLKTMQAFPIYDRGARFGEDRLAVGSRCSRAKR